MRCGIKHGRREFATILRIGKLELWKGSEWKQMASRSVGRLGLSALKHYNRRKAFLWSAPPQTRQLASSPLPLVDLLARVRDGTLSPGEAFRIIEGKSGSNDQVLESFANLDHERSKRTGFPEAVFAEGKTPAQVASILDDMARSLNESTLRHDTSTVQHSIRNAILATRVTQEMYDVLSKHNFQHGIIAYNPVARIVSMQASALEHAKPKEHHRGRRVVVATAGTTDIPIAEEAAVTLEAANIPVDRVYDAGVAGLHRIIRALPKLTHPSVGCCIVVAGMDGALPSVVGGLVSVPVIAVPSSIGYGASFGGISALLTMLNSCSPGVGVVNIDNGFGAAALAFKCIRSGALPDELS